MQLPRKIYKVEEDLKPYLHPLQPWNQQVPLPNLKLVTDPAEALRLLARHSQCVKYYNAAVKLPFEYARTPSNYPEYVNLYLMSNIDGRSWNGTGVLLTSNEYPNPRVFTFALCLHEKTEEGHRPNHGRGWHPGHCKHCNMDMTVDSGD